jgi:hypothetical protein
MIRSDNRIENLRDVTHRINSRNCPIYKHNTSGITGVTFYKKKWVSQISIDDKNIYLGRFTHFDDAVKARWIAEVNNKWTNCKSTSSAFMYLKERKILPKIYTKHQARTILSRHGNMEERRICSKQLKIMKRDKLDSI